MKKPGPKRVDPLARFLSKVEFPDDPDACWVWTACLTKQGYGRFGAGGMGATTHAYRWSYERFVGPVPDGLVLDHLCCNKACVNPAHLEPVTNSENLRRAFSRITHCKYGHPFDEENTYVWVSPAGRTHRRCRICNAAAQRKLRRGDDVADDPHRPVRR